MTWSSIQKPIVAGLGLATTLLLSVAGCGSDATTTDDAVVVTDPSAGTSTTVKLFKGGSASTTQIPATVTVSEDGKTVTLDPSILLAKRTTYTAKIVGAKDLAGNALPDKAWSFKTGLR